MDSFELNKIMGAILGTCLVLLTLNISANALFSPSKPAKQGFAIAVPDGPAEAPGGAPAEPEKPIAAVLAAASVEKGAIVRQEVRLLPHASRRAARRASARTSTT